MHCDTLIEPVCAIVSHAAGSAASAAASAVLSGLADAVTAGVRWTVANTATWWTGVPSPDLATEPAVTRMQAWLLPVTAAVAIASLIAAGARMVIARRANPLLDVTGGLLALAAATTVGTVVPALLLRAGDAWSAWILRVSTGGQFAQRLATVLVLGGSAAPAVVLIFGVLAIVLSLVQAVLMLFRQAALVILAGALPLAAAGAMAPLTRPWIRKITSWMLALICYKPAAAAVYAAAFTMIGSGRDPRTVLMGFVMLVLSVLALPALMKFFTWTTGTVDGWGSGGQLLGAAAMGAIAVGTMRPPAGGAGGPARAQASYLTSRLGSPPDGTVPGIPDGPAGAPPAQTAAAGAPPRQAGPAGSSGPRSDQASTGSPPAQAVPAGAPPGQPGPPGSSGWPAETTAAPTGAAASPATSAPAEGPGAAGTAGGAADDAGESGEGS